MALAKYEILSKIIKDKCIICQLAASTGRVVVTIWKDNDPQKYSSIKNGTLRKLRANAFKECNRTEHVISLN